MNIAHILWVPADDDRTTGISQATSYQAIGEFWDAHSLADYDGQTHEVEMQFLPSARRAYVGIDPELLEELRTIARRRRITTQTLINLWLRQRVDQVKEEISLAAT